MISNLRFDGFCGLFVFKRTLTVEIYFGVDKTRQIACDELKGTFSLNCFNGIPATRRLMLMCRSMERLCAAVEWKFNQCGIHLCRR